MSDHNAREPVLPNDPSVVTLIQRLVATEEDLRALLGNNIDMVIDPVSGTPIFFRETQQALQVAQAELETQNEELRTTEEQLSNAHDRYLDLYDFAPVGYFTVDTDWKIVGANLTGASMLGAERQKLLQQPLTRFIAPESQDDFHFFRLHSPPHEATLELQLNKENGETFWAHFGITVAQYPTEYRLAVSDITRRKQAETALRELNTTLENQVEARTTELQAEKDRIMALVNSIPEEVWFADTAGNFTLANPSAQHEFGIEATGDIDVAKLAASLEVLRPDGSPRPVEEAPPLRALKGEVVWNQEEIIRTPAHGELRYRLVNSAPVKDADGIIIGSVSVVRDITESKQAETTLRQSEERYHLLFDGMTEGFALHELVMDEQGNPVDYRFLDINSAFERLTGLQRKDVIGNTHKEVLPGDDPKWLEMYSHVALTGEPLQLENYSPALQRHFEVLAYRPSPLQFAVIFMDVTLRKQAEVALQSSLREKEVLLKEIHHRVKNNMQVISSLVNLQAETLDNPGLSAHFNNLRDQIRSMGLVHEKLYQSDSLAHVDFAEYAESLLSYLWHAHGNATKNIRYTLDLQPVTLSVEMAVPCGLILNELITNALKHAFRDNTNGELQVALHTTADGQVTLRVSDNGPGLPAGLDWRKSTTLGLRLVQMLTGQIRGTLDITSADGVTVEVGFRG